MAFFASNERSVASAEPARVELVGEAGRLVDSSRFRFPLFVPACESSSDTRRKSDCGIHSSNCLSEPSWRTWTCPSELRRWRTWTDSVENRNGTMFEFQDIYPGVNDSEDARSTPFFLTEGASLPKCSGRSVLAM